MSPLQASVRLAVVAAVAVGCAENPGADTRCVYETGEIASGRCLTECESRCNLENLAGCATTSCVPDCEHAASAHSSACQDASYTLWRCLRLSSLPQVDCNSQPPALFAPESACRAEFAAEQAACAAVDAGDRADVAHRDSGH